jgi:hypothetical protein
MKEFLLILLVLASASPAKTRASEAGTGPSNFQGLLDHWGGQVPFPPEKWVEALIALDSTSPVIATIIPHGRSLVRDSTSYRQPRNVLSWETGSSSRPYALFVGYTQATESLEVIAFNQESHRFDFFLVSDYKAGKKPRVNEMPREACTGCHQHEGPLFSVADWDESIDNSDVHAAVAGSAPLDPFSKYLLYKEIHQDSNLIINAPLFESRVHESSELLQNQRICEFGCGTNVECRRFQLRLALSSVLITGSGLSDSEAARFTELKKKTWPRDGFAYRSDSLPDRLIDPSAPLDPDAMTRDQDPLTPRFFINGVGPDFAQYGQCINLSERAVQKLSAYSNSEIMQRFDRRATSAWILAHPWPNQSDLLEILSP